MVGVVPSLVVVFEVLVGEVVNDVHKSDWHTAAVFAAREEGLDAAFHHSVPRARAHTPFAVDDSALVVNLLVVEGERAAPIAEHEEAGVDEPTVFVGGDVVDVVNRLVETCVCVEFAAKTYAVFFEHFDEAFAGEVLASVERHMFKEVGESALVFFFLHRADFLRDVEARLIFRFFVVTDVVGEPVVKASDASVGVLRQGHKLRHSADGQQYGEG